MGPQPSEGVLYIRRGYVGRHAAYIYAAGKSAGGASEPSSSALWFGSAGAGAGGCDEVVESRVDMGRTDAPLSIVYLAFGSAGCLLHRRHGRHGRAIWSGSPPSVAVQLSFRGTAPVYRMGGDKQLHTHSGHQNGSQGTRIMCKNSFFGEGSQNREHDAMSDRMVFGGIWAGGRRRRLWSRAGAPPRPLTVHASSLRGQISPTPKTMGVGIWICVRHFRPGSVSPVHRLFERGEKVPGPSIHPIHYGIRPIGWPPGCSIR